MLETAKKEGYAYPAVNVTTIEVINGALRAFSEAKSDGIIQVSIGGGKFASGSSVGNSALGAIVLAEATRRLAEKHNVLVALHTGHCQPEHVDTFLRPLIAESRRRVERGEAPLFNSHMLDASTLPMAENLKLSRELLKECAELGIVLEIEIGVGVNHAPHDRPLLGGVVVRTRLGVDDRERVVLDGASGGSDLFGDGVGGHGVGSVVGVALRKRWVNSGS